MVTSFYSVTNKPNMQELLEYAQNLQKQNPVLRHSSRTMVQD